VGADAVILAEGSTPMLGGNEHWSPTGVKEQGMWTEGPPGTWEALSSPPTKGPERVTGGTIPWPDGGVTCSSSGAKQTGEGRYLRAKATKSEEKEERESEH
jgi:hypothetical protein